MSGVKFYIEAHSQLEVFHGGIGNVDIERILAASGFEAIRFPYRYNFSILAKLARFTYLFKSLLSIPKTATVVFQFPLYARIHKLLIHALLKKKTKVICYIADINGLKDGDEFLLQREIRELKKYKYFIIHNQGMQEWVEKNISNPITAQIEFFDFLARSDNYPRKIEKTIAFAGNLEKSMFLEKLNLIKDQQLRFYVYGPGGTQTMFDQEGIFYKGIYPPYSLPAKMEGSFGLVWDGDSIDGPGGSLGHYMQYISHHKLSLYILSGLPLIVPSFAGSASLIEKYKIGFTIRNLHEISRKIEELEEAEYEQMILNMKPLALKISSGQCLLTALNKLMELTQPAMAVNPPKNIVDAF